MLIAVGTESELRALEELFAPREPLPARRSTAGSRRALGPEVALERPSEAEHGDYATNVALRLAPARKRAAARARRGAGRAAAELPDVERAEVAGPGFVNLCLADAWFAGARRVARAGLRRRLRRRAERVQVELVSANPTGPITVAAARNGANGDCVARLLELGGNEVEREYYYNDAGAPDGQVPRVGRGDPARRGAARGRLPGRLRRRARRELPGDPVPPMLEQIEQTLERFRIHFDSWAQQSELERAAARVRCRGSTRTRRRARVWARSTRATATRRTACSSAPTTGEPTYRAADVVYLVDKLERGFDRAIYVLGADHHGTRNWYAAVARDARLRPERVEVLLYQLVHLTRAASRRRCRSGAATSSSSTSSWTRSASTPRAGTSSTAAPTSRSRSTSTWRPSAREKNPVYYVQYAHARIAGILRNAGDADGLGRAGRRRSRREERDLVKRLAELPEVVRGGDRAPRAARDPDVRDPRRGRLPPLLPPHRVLESDQQAFRLALCRATQAVIATCLGLVGVDAPERM